MSQVVELFILAGLILINSVLAMSEMAIVSSRRARLQQRASRGDAGAQAALALLDNPSYFLSAVQIGITLISILAGAFSGATLADSLAASIATVPILQPYSRAIAMGLIVVGVGYVSLVIGELVPKRIALNHPEAIAGAVAIPMGALAKVAAPAVWLLSASTELVLRLFRIRTTTQPEITEEEIKIMVEQAADAGIVEHVEQEMVVQVFKLGDRKVDELMTHRLKIEWLDIDDPLEENLHLLAASSHSHLPVCKDDRDHVIGLVSSKALLSKFIEGGPIDLQELLIKPHVVPESMPAFKLLDFFRRSGQHLAMVADEYGGIAGLVTTSDILEAIAGEFPTPEDADDPEAIRRDDGSWLIDAMMSIEKFKNLLDVETMPDEETLEYETVAGFVIAQLGHIPKEGEHFDHDGMRIEIVDMDHNRIDKLLVQLIEPASEDDENPNGAPESKE
jgi:putative hemolysin